MTSLATLHQRDHLGLSRTYDKMAEEDHTEEITVAYDVVQIDQGQLHEGELALVCDMFLRILTGIDTGTLYTYDQEEDWPGYAPVRQGIAFEIFWCEVN